MGGLPSIPSSASQGRWRELLAGAVSARSILALATRGGYRTIRLARARSPDDRLATLELDLHLARAGPASLEHAGVVGPVEVIVGPARWALARLKALGCGPFDVVYLDADKEPCVVYPVVVLALSRTGQ